MYREVDSVIKKMKVNVDDLNFKYMVYLKKWEDEIIGIFFEI